MAFFSGVHTGDFYETGKVYQSSNGYTYGANKDGSFTNLNTGHVLQGSAGQANVQWYGGGSPNAGASAPTALTGGGSGPGSERVVTGDRPNSGGSGPSSSVVRTTKKRGGSIMLNDEINFTPWEYDDLGNAATPPGQIKTREDGLFVETQGPSEVRGRSIPMGNLNWEQNPWFPPASVIEDEFGEAEIYNPIAGLAITGTNLGNVVWNVQRGKTWVDSYVEPFVDQILRGAVGGLVDVYNKSPRGRLGGR